jgi:hypothetical protein
MVFLGLAWFVTAPAMGVLIGKVAATADRHDARDRRDTEDRERSLFTFLEADLRRSDPRPVAGQN